MQIGQRLIDEHRPLVIAELASAHEGSIEQACTWVRAVAEAGGEAVKFQLVIAKELVTHQHPQAGRFRSLELGREGWATVLAETRRCGLIPFADLFGEQSLALAQELGFSALKIPSATFTDAVLVPQVARLGLPTLLSTAGASQEEIGWVVEQFRCARHEAFVLLHGFQGFPTPPEQAHLARLGWLRERFGCPVGLSDHAPGDSPWAQRLPLMASALGAVIIEKHVTLDRSRHGTDWVSSLEPGELRELIAALRAAPTALGRPGGVWQPSEAAYRQQMRRHLVARHALAAGEIVTSEKLMARRVASSDAIDPWFLQPAAGRPVVGQKAARAIAEGEALTWSDLANPVIAVCIAVRLKSQRLPRKALADLAGRTAVERLIERLKTSRRAQRLVLCTSTLSEDQPLVVLAQRLGIAWVCGDADDVMGRFLQAADQAGADVIVRATGDNPLTDAETIDRMIEVHLAHDAEYTYTEDLPVGTCPEIIAVPALRRLHGQAEDPTQTEYMTLYLRQPGAVRAHRYSVEDAQLVRPQYRLTLDTPEDLALLRELYRRLGGRSDVALMEVIRLLDATPALAGLNARVAQQDLSGRINTRLRAPAATTAA
ncbi:MAG: N-acetylneuraminate synthase family protein [Candidatus Omnitrophica bacterium]|nr:N-acetylneuraminate synthase family protein [Candidatus Omnitrophota bacterium]